MKDEILKANLSQARANFARVLKLQAVSEVRCSGETQPQGSAVPNTKEYSEFSIIRTPIIRIQTLGR